MIVNGEQFVFPTERKMQKFLRGAALFLIFVMLSCSLLCSCSSTKDENNISEDATVLYASGKEVSYGLFRYFFLNYKAEYSKEEIAADPDAVYKKIEDDTIESIQGLYAVLKMCEDKGISINDDEIKSQVSETIDSIKQQYINEENDKSGERGYKQDLAANFMTDSVLRFLVSVDLCETALYDALTEEGGDMSEDEETVRGILFGDEYIRVVQIYINAENGESYETNKKTAETVLAKAKSGVDFDTLIGNYSNDYTMTTDGYYICHGFMAEEFEDVAYSLEIGEVSEILELDDGFHIIKRLQKEDEYLEDNYENLRDRYLSCVFYKKLDAVALTIDITKGEKYADIDFSLIALS